MTHYILPFTSTRGREQRTACGVWVTWDQHTVEPECPQCRAWLEADDAEAKQLNLKWEAEAVEARAARIANAALPQAWKPLVKA